MAIIGGVYENWCAFEIKLGGKRIEEGVKNFIKVCRHVVENGGKEPVVKAVICGLTNAVYQREDGVFVFPITSLKTKVVIKFGLDDF